MNSMHCIKCYNQKWCICKHIYKLYKRTIFKGKCLCCYERMRTVNEFQRRSKRTSKDYSKRIADRILKAFINNKNDSCDET